APGDGPGPHRRRGPGSGRTAQVSYASGSRASTDRPPSTGTVAPVTNAASSDSRWAITAATSAAVPTRPSGWIRRISSSTCAAPSGPRPSRYAAYRSVAIEPSTTAFTRTPCGPYSTASARVRPSIAALAVTYGSHPGTGRWAGGDVTWTIAPPGRAARKRRTAGVAPTTAGARLG